MARKKNQEQQYIKALTPKDPDAVPKYMGDEPFFPVQPEETKRGESLARALSWYHRFYSKKEAKENLAVYLDYNDRTADAKLIRRVPESEFMSTLCWLARTTLRGLELTVQENTTLQNEINRLVKLVHKPEEEPEEAKESNRPNIQEVMRDKASQAAGELEGMLDMFVKEGSKPNFNAKAVDVLSRFNVMPQHISLIVEVWKKKREEFEEVLGGREPELVEGYNNFSKVQLKNLIKFIDAILGDLGSYINIKKASKAPRKRKAVPVEKIVSKLKYLKEFKDPAAKIDIVSIHPTKLYGCSEAWVYDTAKRKLHHYVADDHVKTLGVKGNTLLGFDSMNSEVKTLRKPAEQIKAIMGSKPAARKFFKDIKAVAAKSNGRFNPNMVILKAF